MLQDAVAVHNATPHPHSELGESPFKAMFGFEPTLPGWQCYRAGTIRDGEQSRTVSSDDDARQSSAERLRLDNDEEVSVGDVVVYQLSNYERS